MAETLISPGVLARENDQSFITQQPVQVGAAIVGPAVKGPVEQPTVVTSYSDYQNRFGTTFESGSLDYTFFTSIAAYNYFNNGGNTLLVTRVVNSPSTWNYASASVDGEETGNVVAGTNLLNSLTSGGVGGTAFVANSVATTTSGNGTGITLDVETSSANGKLLTDADALLNSIDTNTTIAGAGTYTGVSFNTNGNGTGALATVVVTGTTTPTVTSITVTTPGLGYAANNTLSIPAGSLGKGQLITSDNVTSETAPTAIGNVTTPYTLSQTSTTGAGTGATFTITGNGNDALLSVVVANIGTGYAIGEEIQIDKTDLIAAGFTGATSNLVITVSQQMLQNSGIVDFTLVAGDLLIEPVEVEVNVAGTGYVIGDTVVVAKALIGNPTADLTITLTADDIVNLISFELEAIDKGVIWNNTGSVLSQAAMESGSSDNIRWEISTANTSSGTFSLLVRRGNDTQNNKVVLESWNNLSLDPTQDNFITKVIGDEKYNYQSNGNYLQVSGSYPNASRYVRVKSVNKLTPNYLDNAGNAKDQYTGSIPIVGSGSYNGSFAGGVGNVVPSTRTMNMYQYINANDSQGLVGSDYTDMLNLLSNQDNYQFNSYFLPGLTNDTHTSQITTAINNTQQRGDNILVIDPVPYASSITATTTEAASRNTSYATMYWPWLQVIDPDLGDRTWVPASTMVGGVYAYNDSVSEPWFAPAGINRGGLTNVVRAERQLPAASRDALYEENINPIATFPGTGVVVYGQKTLQRQASALDRVNVRRLLIALKSYIGQVAQTLVFEQNTAATRNNFLAAVNPYLESVQQRQGLYAFKVVMDDSNNTPDVIDRNQLVGAIYLQPTRTAEFIYLDFNVLPTGATFPS